MKQCRNTLRKLKKMMGMLTHQTPPEMLKMKLIQHRTYWYRNFGNYLLRVLMELRGFNNRRIGIISRWMKNLKKEGLGWKRNALLHSFTSYACAREMINEQSPMRGTLDFIEEKNQSCRVPGSQDKLRIYHPHQQVRGMRHPPAKLVLRSCRESHCQRTIILPAQ